MKDEEPPGRTPRRQSRAATKDWKAASPARMTGAAGTCDLLRFFTDGRRFPDLDTYAVAVIAALLTHVNTTGQGGSRYHAHPSQKTLARHARVTEPTVRKWIKYFVECGWIKVAARRAGKRNASNVYDVTSAAEWIVEQRSPQPQLTVVRGHHET